jgi:hypothetical protein
MARCFDRCDWLFSARKIAHVAQVVGVMSVILSARVVSS